MIAIAQVLEASGKVFDAAEQVFVDDELVICDFGVMLKPETQDGKFVCPPGCRHRCGCSRLGRYFLLSTQSATKQAA